MEERETQARWPRFAGVLAAIVAVAVVAAPAGGGDTGANAVADVPVTVSNNVFTPKNVTINQGDTVTWTNQGVLHNVVFDDGSFTYPIDPSSSNWSIPRQFNSPGVFTYYCAQHGGPGEMGMSGRITVNPAPAPSPPPPGGGTPPPGGGNPPPGGGTPPGTPSPGAPGAGKSATTVTLQVSDATPIRCARVRFFGAVKPERDGRLVQLQRRSRGSFRTVLRIKLSDAGSTRSKFSKRLRVLGDAVFRARLPADSGHEAGTSRARRLDVR
jgi:plastocyanin